MSSAFTTRMTSEDLLGVQEQAWPPDPLPQGRWPPNQKCKTWNLKTTKKPSQVSLSHAQLSPLSHSNKFNQQEIEPSLMSEITLLILFPSFFKEPQHFPSKFSLQNSGGLQSVHSLKSHTASHLQFIHILHLLLLHVWLQLIFSTSPCHSNFLSSSPLFHLLHNFLELTLLHLLHNFHKLTLLRMVPRWSSRQGRNGRNGCNTATLLKTSWSWNARRYGYGWN